MIGSGITPRQTIARSLLLALALAACGGSDGPSGPRTGAISIASSAVTTLDNSTFNYTIGVDNAAPRTIATGIPSSFVVADLSAGAHTVTIAGLPGSCSAGAAVRNVSVVAGDTIPVTFDVQCSRTTGDFTLTSSTTGVDLDGDGYTVMVDGASRGSVNSSGNTTVRLLSPGAHTVSLTGISSNCAPSVATKTVNITAGVNTPVSFDIVCVTRTYVMRFDMVTTGAEIDPNGFFLVVDNNVARVGANGTFRLTNVPLGRRTVVVVDVASNCGLTVSPVRNFDIVATDDTVRVPVSAVCVARGTGEVATTVADALSDTLANTTDPTPPLDVVSTTVRYAPGWLMLSLRFASPVLSALHEAPNSLSGVIDLDTDEVTTTGYQPLANSFGTFRSQGVEVSMVLDADSTQALLYRNGLLVGGAGMRIAGDSVMLSIPVSLLNDDGNLTVSGVLGTLQRPTDIVPNAGVITARRPAGVAPESRAAGSPAAPAAGIEASTWSAVYDARSTRPAVALRIPSMVPRWRR